MPLMCGVPAVVDFGEAVRAKEAELEFFPQLMIDRAVPADRPERRFPAEFVIGQEIRIVGRNIAAPVDSARPEAARPGRVEHQIFLRLPLRIQAVGEATALGALGNQLAIRRNPPGSCTGLLERRPGATFAVGGICLGDGVVEPLAADRPATGNAGLAAPGTIVGLVRVNSVGPFVSPDFGRNRRSRSGVLSYLNKRPPAVSVTVRRDVEARLAEQRHSPCRRAPAGSATTSQEAVDREVRSQAVDLDNPGG